MRTPFRGLLFLTAAAVLLFLLFASFLSAQPAGIDPHGLAQIQALLEEKESRTPAQRKIDSNLLYAAKMNRRQAIANGVATLETGVDVSPSGTVVVDIVGSVGDPLLDRLEGLGAKLIDARIGSRSVRAEVSLFDLETIAAWPDVVFVNRKQEATTVGNAAASLGLGALKSVAPGLLPRLKAGFATRAANVRRSVAAALKARAALKPLATSTINVSEGRVTHRADLVVSTLGVTGAGVKVGVLSDGVSSLAAIQASGDLGGVTVLPGQAGSGDEGTAMLEIVHDLAPGAQLYFATAFTSITSFGQNIKDLRTAGCDIIVDDVFYYVETPFQRGQAPSVISTTNGGIVTQAVATVTAAGALYFSSAGNSGNLDDAQSGTWEGDFADGGAVAPPVTGTGNLHSFGANPYDALTATGSPTNLYWSDPLGGSTNDYDLFRLNSTGTSVLSSSTNVQTGTQDPYEQINTAVAGDRIVIVKRTGAAARFLHLSTNRGRLSVGTAGETHGHSATPAQFAFTVAATPAAAGFGGPPNPSGPYPGVFSGSNHIELFSSDGPRRVFFNADSTAITPGNFSSTGGFSYAKPDFTAADGVSCAAPGFDPFFGTSAAAPHAGAIAALVKSAAPAFTQTQVANALTSTAIDIEAAGPDRQSGSGILDALAAVQSTGVTPRPGLLLGTVTATEVGGNANGSIEPGECGVLDIQLTNASGIAATAVSGTLTSPTPGVTIVAGTAPYPDIPGSSSRTNITRFKFSLSNTVACPLNVDFTLTVSFSGSGSPAVFTFVLRTGAPPVTASSTLDVTAPPNVAGVYTAATGSQTGRMNRFGIVTACGAPTSYPGTFSASGARQYDAYTFTNCATNPVCVRVSVTQTSGSNLALFSAAYSPSYNPASIGTNYLADAGVSYNVNSPASYSFDVAAGATFVVVVHEVNTGGGIGANYTLTVDGMCLPCTTYTGTGCPTCPTITVAPASLPSGTAGTAYNQVVTPSGGVGPYGFVVTGLPAGMTATPSASSVTLGGTPTAPFSGSVTVSGADANGCPFSKVYSLTIACPPPGPIPITTASSVCSLSVGNTASVPDLGVGVTYTWGITNGTITGGQGTRTITYTAAASGPINLTVATSGPACTNTGGNTNVTVDPTCGSLYTLAAPCRLIDTRNPNGPTGGPALAANMGRTFPAAGQCGIPADAKAVSLVVVAVNATVGGDVRIFPTGAPLPLVSAINFNAFRNRANNVLVSVGTAGQIDAWCDMPPASTGTTQFVVDVYGYIR